MFEEFSTYLMKFLECHKLFSVLSSQLYHKYHESISVHLKAIIFFIHSLRRLHNKLGRPAPMPLGECIEPSLIVALSCQDTTQCLI